MADIYDLIVLGSGADGVGLMEAFKRLIENPLEMPA